VDSEDKRRFRSVLEEKGEGVMRCNFTRVVSALAVALALVAGAGTGWAQNVATGQIFGAVADTDGGVLPGVTVRATNPETGLTRFVVTDGVGAYRLDLLPSGTYEVRAELAGFRPEVKQGIDVTLGSIVRVDFTLQVGAQAEEIVVTAAAPVIETTNPNVSNSVSSEAIANLPLDGRDFLDFIVLTPGAVAGDTTEVNGGRGGVNVNGRRAIQNSYNIDGSNSQSSFFGEERGGTRPPFTFSQAAIKEFQVINSSYSTQYGNASGGVINAITKSGTNDLQGEVFYFARPDSFVGDYADQRDAEASDRKQYGFTLGGPLVRDKVHFFLSYDGQRLDDPLFVEYRNFPAGREADYEALTGLSWEQEVGDMVQTNDADSIMLKLDWQLADSHLLTLRDNWNDQKGENLTSDFETAGWSNNGLEENSFNSLVASFNSVLGGSSFNEAILQFAKEERPRTANSTAIPEVRIASSYDATFGQNNFLPNWLTEERTQFIDNFTHYAGAHTLKAGVNVDMVSYDDGFFRYGGGNYYFRSWNDFFAGKVYTYTQSFSDYNGQVKYDVNYFSGYVQDEWRVNPNLVVTGGLRYDLQDHADPRETNPDYPDTGQIPNDTDNWAPRVGFAWDVNGDGKQVVRGGAGYFYDYTPTLLDANAMLTNGVRVVTVELRCSATVPCPTWPNRVPDLGSLAVQTPNLFVYDPGFENPETLRVSLGYEREIASDFSVGVDAIYSKTEKLQRKQDQNLTPDGGTSIDGRPTYDSGDNYPMFYKIMQFTSDAEGEYVAFVLKGHKRFTRGWMMDASYTYAKSKDNDSNERSVSSSSDYPEDQYNIDADWGPSNYDVRHKVVLSATVELPWGFLVSAIGNFRTGFPYTATDYRDLNGDGYYNDRATVEVSPGVYEHYTRNSFNQPSVTTFDMRLAKTFAFGGGFEAEIIGEVFNLFDKANWRTTNTRLVRNSAGDLNDYFGELSYSGSPRTYQVGLKFRW